MYDEVLEERIDEIVKMSKEISYGDLVYDFKGPFHFEAQCMFMVIQKMVKTHDNK